MKLLVACEESQRVCTAFRKKGHEAYSCDLQACSGGHPEWHIRGDALQALNGGIILTDDGIMHDIGNWDMLIAHPPCTYLSNAGACRLFKKIDGVSWINADRFYKGLKAKEFFLKFLHADIPRIAVENPIPSKVFCLPQYTQIIHPYFFGDPYEKKTCLWLKGIPPLEETERIPPQFHWISAGSFKADGTRRDSVGVTHNQKLRSKTFPAVAKAMAEQWG